MEAAVVALLVGVGVLIVLMVLQLGRARENRHLSAPIEGLSQTLQRSETQMAVLAEKVSQIDKMQGELTQTLQRLSQTTTSGLADAQRSLQSEIVKTREVASELRATLKARQTMDDERRESVRHLEGIIARTQKGVAGEKILDEVFSQLPTEWQERNFIVGGKIVEFAPRLPNQLLVPIDSKWPATDLLESLKQTEDPEEQGRLRRRAEQEVTRRASEVRRYIDPNRTTLFGIAAVPDAVYQLCPGARLEAFKQGVILISYSMFVPYLLMLFETYRQTSQTIDLQRLDAALGAMETSLNEMERTVEGHLGRGITMTENARKEIATLLGSIRSNLVGLRLSAPQQEELESGDDGQERLEM